LPSQETRDKLIKGSVNPGVAPRPILTLRRSLFQESKMYSRASRHRCKALGWQVCFIADDIIVGMEGKTSTFSAAASPPRSDARPESTGASGSSERKSSVDTFFSGFAAQHPGTARRW
jgi:hypothetical protein